MSALSKPELTPDEQFIADAVRDGRATRQEVSMKAIGTPDVALQARVVHLNKDHCHRLDKARQLTGSLAPIVLFRDARSGKLYLADGHHRHWVYQNAKLPAIPAWVIDSSNPELEALEFATMCNRELCLGRTEEDIRRAVEMLLSNEIWWKRSDNWIAGHVGISSPMVRRVRLLCAEKLGRDLPGKVECQNRSPVAYQHNDSAFSDKFIVREKKSHKDRQQSFYVRRNGQRVYLGIDRREAEKKAKELEDSIRDRRMKLNGSYFTQLMIGCGFRSVFHNGKAIQKYPGVNAYHKTGVILVACDFSCKAKLPLAVADAIAASEELRRAVSSAVACEYAKELGARKVILCYPEDGPFYLMELYKAAGFEFVKPEDLKAALERPRS